MITAIVDMTTELVVAVPVALGATLAAKAVGARDDRDHRAVKHAFDERADESLGPPNAGAH